MGREQTPSSFAALPFCSFGLFFSTHDAAAGVDYSRCVKDRRPSGIYKLPLPLYVFNVVFTSLVCLWYAYSAIDGWQSKSLDPAASRTAVMEGTVFAAVFAVAAAVNLRVAFVVNRDRARARAGLCWSCAHDRAGLAPDAACPECGVKGTA